MGPDVFPGKVPNPVSLVAYQVSQLYLWQREGVLPLLLEDGALTWELCGMMVQRMQHASQIMDRLTFQPVPGRLARLPLDRFSGAADDCLATQPQQANHNIPKRELPEFTECRELLFALRVFRRFTALTLNYRGERPEEQF